MLSSFWVSQFLPDFVSTKAQNSIDLTLFKGTNSCSENFELFDLVLLKLFSLAHENWSDSLLYLLNVTV